MTAAPRPTREQASPDGAMEWDEASEADRRQALLAALRQRDAAIDERDRLAAEVRALRAEQDTLSGLLRGVARRLGALRRAYNISSVDPWERPDYCSKANWAMDCGPALRDWDLCIYHAREEARLLREVERNALRMAKSDDPAHAAAANWILTGGAS